ncbi:Rpn family recombination-promoting nuclease/putative transposase [Kamptonema formosum]|uniref:Rpn family recombination-promoting nuclease/putative transposase n=1 Tax=Kamptonema formosum TaxID=331992 RepID=UPI00034D236C|nr:Rpn family recombination-promoting nuclease/putative transposase [Oscillatoria sp. PCC 10802]
MTEETTGESFSVIEPQADYDTPWKEAIEEYLDPFMAFFFPQVHDLVDWTRAPQSLDKELQQILRESESGKRIADKLFQVWLRDGAEVWVLIHIEVQSQEESNFARRMYQYHYRTFDRYERPVISLGVLGDERASWRPSSYGYALGGCELSLKFPVVKLLDYQAQWQTLEQSANPFAVMVMAHLKTKATRGTPQEREQWKWSLVRGLFERDYNREQIEKLFRLVDWMMALPEELQRSFEEKLTRYQEEMRMPLLSRIEQRAMQAGIERGIQQNARESVIEILEMRFEEVPAQLREAINRIEDAALLKQLHRQAVTIGSVPEFQQLLSPNLAEN